MQRLEVTLQTITPLFMGGSDPRREPELRAASVRGALRFWLRALLSGALGDKVKPEVERWAKPFGVLLEQVIAEVARFAHGAPDCLNAESLGKQPALIEHYPDKGLTI